MPCLLVVRLCSVEQVPRVERDAQWPNALTLEHRTVRLIARAQCRFTGIAV